MLGFVRIVSLTAAMLLLAGCADFATPVAVLPPKPEHAGKEPTHTGIACAHKIFWVFSFGDSHFREAKRQGGVVDVATVETISKVLLVDTFPLNFYKRQCTEVSGYSGSINPVGSKDADGKS